MLEELHVAGLGVIEDATLSLSPGLNVLTGETGAGKTLITTGLALALGARASQSVVRPEALTAGAEARFRLDLPDAEVRAWVEESVGEPEAFAELILARTVGADGRSAARVGGKLAPASVLSSLGSKLVEIHGQSQAERLGAPAAQLEFLNRFAGRDHLEQLSRYREVFAELRHARADLEALELHERDREREKDLLQYQIREIEAANVVVGEVASLEEEEARLTHAERILELVARAEDAVGSDGGAADALRQAAATLQAAEALVPGVGVVAGRAISAAAETEDLLADIRSYRESVQVDPARLTEVAERLHALKGLQRKYGEHEEAILVFLQQARQRLAELEDERGARSELEARTTRLGGQVASLAASLTDRRQEAAPRLAAALAEEVQHLGMPGATVRIELIANAEFGPDGAESAEIRFAGGPKQQPLPLARTASGGELSRMMLACRTVLSDLDDVPTLVFDEVDAGIGGRTAQAVGARLAHLASRRQVVVVTHLAQIAAPADRHFVVSKENGIARVRQVDGEQRVEEIARMLSGTTGDVSLAHARELIGDEGSRRRRVRAGAGGVR